MYMSNTYVELKNTLDDWIQEIGGAVSNRPLSLLNRAQEILTMYRPWEDMITDTELTVTDLTVSLPSDMAQLIMLYADLDNNGKPDYYYYSQAWLERGYTLKNTFSKATGHSRTALFYTAPTLGVWCRYTYKLEDFTDDEVTPQLSFFPGELLLAQARVLHLTETGLSGPEMQINIKSLEDKLTDYEQSHHFVDTDLNRDILDRDGFRIFTEGTDLTGDYREDRATGLGNDYDAG